MHTKIADCSVKVLCHVIVCVACTIDVNPFCALWLAYLSYIFASLSWISLTGQTTENKCKIVENRHKKTHLVCYIDDFSFVIKSQSSGVKKLGLPADSIPVALCTTSQRSNFTYPSTIITPQNPQQLCHCLIGWNVKHIFQQPNRTSFPWKIVLNPGSGKFVM